ncbi:unnamed protein product [Clonostachys byssicola]|uniref:Uncharacterized protein n=1 Tax=Clonostachys byssicola TaxID=160290 RepID=A0A9N9UKN6_9HYPO|nr:unnamed protein product [Clonostachys byssicola]
MRINQVAGRVDQRQDGPSEKKKMQMQNAQVKCGGRVCHSGDIGRRDQAGATVNRLPSIVPGHAERQHYMGEKNLENTSTYLGRTTIPRDKTDLLPAAHSHRHPGLTWLQVTSTRLQDRARGSAPPAPSHYIPSMCSLAAMSPPGKASGWEAGEAHNWQWGPPHGLSWRWTGLGLTRLQAPFTLETIYPPDGFHGCSRWLRSFSSSSAVLKHPNRSAK